MTRDPLLQRLADAHLTLREAHDALVYLCGYSPDGVQAALRFVERSRTWDAERIAREGAEERGSSNG